jgi:hypothetical protein
MTASFDIVMFNHNPYPLFQYSVNKFWQRYSHNLNSQIIASSWTITRVLLKRYKQYIGTDQILNVILFDGDFSSYGSSFSTSNMCCATHFFKSDDKSWTEKWWELKSNAEKPMTFKSVAFHY